MALDWGFDPFVAARALVVQESNEDQERAAGFAATAAWTAEALPYLVDLDARLGVADEPSILGYTRQPVELAHARWAAGDAITAVDLCAAALGRLFADYPTKRGHEMDFGHARRELLDHAVAAEWVEQVATDPYHSLLEAMRHAAVHRTVHRHVTVDVGAGTAVGRWSPSLQGPRIEVGVFLARSRDFATRHVGKFLRDAIGGRYSPGAETPEA